MKYVTIPLGHKLLREIEQYHALMKKDLSATSQEDFAELTRLFSSISMKTAHTVMAEVAPLVGPASADANQPCQ